MASKIKEAQVYQVMSVFFMTGENYKATARETGLSVNTVKKIVKNNQGVLNQVKGGAKNAEAPVFKKKEISQSPAPAPIIPDVIKDATIDPVQINSKLALVQEADKARLDYLTNLFKAKSVAIERCLSVLEWETNLDNIQKTLKTLHEITKGDSGEGDSPHQQPNNVSYIQIINNRLIQAGYGIKTNHRTQEGNEKPL
jgi:hypothetical protein